MADYNAVQNQVLPDAGAAILGGIQGGQKIRQGILEDYMNRKKIGQQDKVEALQQQYLGATDEKQKQALLGQMAVYSPEHAKGILAVANSGIMPFAGDSFKSQGANIHYQALKAQNPDMPEGMLRAKAYNAALSGDNIALGAPNTLTVPSQNLLGGGASMSENVVNGVPLAKMNVADHADSATPEEIKFAKDFAAQPGETQADWYAKNAGAHPDLPPGLTPEIKSSLYEAADHFAVNASPPATSAPSADVESLASAMIAGREPYPSGMAMRARPELKDALNLARQKDPNYDFATAAGRLKTYKDMTSGKSAEELEALNTALGHYSTLMDKWAKLDNGSIPVVNAVGNKISSAMGNPEVSGFKQTADLLAPELIKAYRASHSQAETDKFQNNFDVNASPEQQKEILQTGAELMQSKIAAKMSRYEKGMGTVEGFGKLAGIDAKGIQTLNKLGVDTTKLGLPGTQAPSAPQASGFKEGQTATNPKTGHTMTFRGGKWQ